MAEPLTPGPQTSEGKFTMGGILIGIVLMILGSYLQNTDMLNTGSGLFAASVAGYSIGRGLAKSGKS